MPHEEYLFGVYEIRENMVNHHKMINAAIATLATCAMLLPVVGSANANESSNTAVLGAGYTATKISHHDRWQRDRRAKRGAGFQT